MADWIIPVFLVFFLAQYLVETFLTVLNLRGVKAAGDAVPAPLAGHISTETAGRSSQYTLAKGRLGLAGDAYHTALTLAVLFSGILPWLEAALAQAGLRGPHLFVAFLAILSVALGLANLPFRLTMIFGIETRFGFNRMTWAMWLKDRLKGLALSAALGLPLLYGVYAFMAFTGRWWWVWLFCFLTAFQLAMVWLYPVVIAPLFNKFTPLPEGELRTRVLALAGKAGFRPRGLFLMDASRRSGHSNAYFTGFFRPRIVLFDTLLEKVSTDQALAVLAHEMGHYRARHVHKALALNLAASLATLYVLSLAIGWAPLFAAFGFPAPGYHSALVLLMLCGGAFTFFLAPLSAWFSRRNEYQADAFAVALSGGKEALASALVRLNDDNLANLHPHPWYVRFHYSHPPLLERLAAMEALAPGVAPPGGMGPIAQSG
ncbi:MAG: M48 family metallopeptidase [SAR324 cluster bacterium]|nr:M48 family metallopeptidase [SAR324 cluster bacterium]